MIKNLNHLFIFF